MNPTELLWTYVDYPEGPCLEIRTLEDGTVERVNDPETFAITPQVLVSGCMHITILDRTYTVIGVTCNLDLVVRRKDEP